MTSSRAWILPAYLAIVALLVAVSLAGGWTL
jgi:hypothetical protein